MHEKISISPPSVTAKMVAVFREEPHFAVPARVCDPECMTDGGQARLRLADRIAGLPGIRTVDNGLEIIPGSVTVFLESAHGPARKRRPPMTLCVLNREGITVYGLGLRDRRHLVTQGWGTLQHDRVLVPYPGNAAELDVCWAVLQHAHFSLLNISVSASVSRNAFYGALPRFSRTTLQ